MLRLTLKSLVANKVRFALTTVGVMLAVSFVVSALVLGDGLRSTFGHVSEDITAGIDLEVRPVSEFGEPEPLSMDLVGVVADIEGVADAVASIEAPDNSVRPMKANGESITTDGPPQLAFNWIDNERLSPFSLVDGTAPEVGQFTIDLDSAAKHDFVIGESYELITPSGRAELTLSGTSSFGDDNATLGAVLMQMNTAQAGDLFGVDGIDTIDVQVADGADVPAVRAAVAAAVPTAEVVDNKTVLDETTADFTHEIDVVGNILLGFGGVALFVSIFIIYNTFAIVLGQRTRELGLLRTVGADPVQIRRSVLGEALVVGMLASAGGIVGGIGVAKALEALFGAIGVDLPEYPLILAPRTLISAVVIGVGVTLLAAIGPARRASRVPAIAALVGGADAGAVGSRTRRVTGPGLVVLGSGAGAIGLAGTGHTAVTIALVASGAISVFLGVTLLSPLVVGAVTGIVGFPMRGITGRLARKNAARNPQRTATTAAALMVGLALVSTALVVGQSMKSNLRTTIAASTRADYFVTDQLEEAEFSTSIAGQVARSEAVDAVTGFRYVEARVDGSTTDIAAADLDAVPGLLALDVRPGGYEAPGSHPVLIAADEAESTGITIGDVVTTEFSNGARVRATVSGVFHDETIIAEDYLFDIAAFDAAGISQADEWLAISVSDDADEAAVEALVAGIARELPDADIETAEEFRDRVAGTLDDVLAMANIMVALAVIIALIGIANTLALSVFERTRELGLVRAVGMSRRQLRRTVRYEAALVATFGAVLGVGVGLLFGWAVVVALPDALATTVAIPFGSIVAVVAVAALAGVFAAWLPARRAGRLDVLDAIAH